MTWSSNVGGEGSQGNQAVLWCSAAIRLVVWSRTALAWHVAASLAALRDVSSQNVGASSPRTEVLLSPHVHAL